MQIFRRFSRVVFAGTRGSSQRATSYHRPAKRVTASARAGSTTTTSSSSITRTTASRIVFVVVIVSPTPSTHAVAWESCRKDSLAATAATKPTSQGTPSQRRGQGWGQQQQQWWYWRRRGCCIERRWRRWRRQRRRPHCRRQSPRRQHPCQPWAGGYGSPWSHQRCNGLEASKTRPTTPTFSWAAIETQTDCDPDRDRATRVKRISRT